MAARMAELGVAYTLDPMLVIELTPPALLDLDGVQALIATSRNGLRGLAASPALGAAVKLPIIVVGPGTAELAREMGFQEIEQGPASARDLVGLIGARFQPGGARLVHLRGDKVAYDLASALKPAGFDIVRQTVYRSRPAGGLAAATVAGLTGGPIDTVVLTSPLAAKTFASLVELSQIIEPCQRLVYVCLSLNVAEGLRRLNPARVHVASAPNSQSTLELIETMARGRAAGSYP